MLHVPHVDFWVEPLLNFAHFLGPQGAVVWRFSFTYFLRLFKKGSVGFPDFSSPRVFGKRMRFSCEPSRLIKNIYEVRLELHYLKLTVRLLKLYHPKRICLIFQPSIFRCLSSMLSQWPEKQCWLKSGLGEWIFSRRLVVLECPAGSDRNDR